MDTINIFISYNPVFVYLTFLFFTVLTNESLSLNEKFLACAPKSCGKGPNISYPFRLSDAQESYCGYPNFDITCNHEEYPVLTLPYDNYLIKDIFYTNQSFQLASASLYEEDTCPIPLHNLTLNRTPFSISPNPFNFSFFYNCTKKPTEFDYPISCASNSSVYSFALFHTDILQLEENYSLDLCRSFVSAPLHINGDFDLSMNYTEILKTGFLLNWTAPHCSTCERSGGRCGFENNEFVCFCTDNSQTNSCLAGSDPTVKLKVGIGLGASFGTVFIMCILFYSYLRCIKNSHAPSAFVSQTHTSSDFYSKYHIERGGSILEEATNNFEAFLEKHGPLGVKRYSYSQVKKMTNSFKEKLGQGGYGSVYKGTLVDGRLVAVKMLNFSKGEGEEFINEVAAISRTSHVNIVTLMGFCLEGHKRALVYEFMPNGSLDKFISHTTTLNIGQHLGWEIIHQIAIGIAQGLEYLHRGCNTRIVHFDIKPHNVLLDENLTPKISDFGLAKSCTRRESIVSMLEARGTIGYIAPEVFCRNFGQVSSKSDVYSYGMMILEIVGGRKKDIQQVEGSDECSEMYFPNWIYKSLELTKNKENLVEEEGELIVRKLKLIGLWCIQTNPLDRPTMSQVIQMLQGSIQTLNIPPKPFLSSSSSPPRFAMYSSTISTL